MVDTTYASSKSWHLKKKYLYIFTIFLLICNWSLSAQSILVKGRVFDAENHAALPFVNIVFNGDEYKGTTADIDGIFSYEMEDALTSITCSYIGYEPFHRVLSSSEELDNIEIYLTPSAIGLEEIVVVAGENPAHRIIRNAIDHKKENDPGRIQSFSYDNYIKTTASIVPLDSNSSTRLPLNLEISEDLDYIMVSESVIRRKYKAPNLNEERVIGNRISGFKDPLFTNIITTLEPFALYEDIITVGDDDFVNPISQGAENRYFFQIQDTIFTSTSDSVFALSFQPKKGKNFSGLTGIVYIHSREWAIQNIIAKPAVSGFLNFNIQQTFEYIDNLHWFPVQFSYEILQTLEGPDGLMGVKMTSRYALSNIEFNLQLEAKEFAEVELILEDSSSRRDEDFWTYYRPEGLSDEEISSYKILDSVGDELHLDNLLITFSKLLQGKFPIGPVDLLLDRLFARNELEGLRFGMGLETNEKLHPNWSVGGYGAYGTGDGRWKYGGSIIYRGDKFRELELRLGYDNHLRPVGISGLNLFNRGIDWGIVAADRFDQMERIYSTFQYRPIRYALVKLSANHTNFRPLSVPDADDATVHQAYENTEIEIGVRYAYKEKLVQSLDQLISLASKYPVLTLVYTKGIKGMWESDFEYNKFEIALDQTVRWKYMGKTKVRVAAGLIDRSVPSALRFSGEGSDFSFLPFLIPNTFQTAAPFEFLSDQYAHLFFKHDFHDLLLQIGTFKPHLAVYQNIGWGNIKHPGDFVESGFKTKEQGYFESGIQLDNLIRINIASLGYLGLGGAVFYRYGPYAYEESSDNFIINFSLGWTSR